jgi:hypothetical protein
MLEAARPQYHTTPKLKGSTVARVRRETQYGARDNPLGRPPRHPSFFPLPRLN